MVLDLGARRAVSPLPEPICRSFAGSDAPPAGTAGTYVRADAPDSPFATLASTPHRQSQLEHFVELENTVREIGRIVKPDGVLYVSVPDAGTITDRVYRWLGRGGGHVNFFRAPADVIGLIEKWTPLRHRLTTILYSSLAS